MANEQLLQNILDTIRDVQSDVKTIQVDGVKRGEAITEMRTVLLGTEEQPAIGLVAQVGRNTSDISRLQRVGALFLGVSSAGGATAWNWDALKGIFLGN